MKSYATMKRDDGSSVEVEFSIRFGSNPSYDDPGDPNEVEIVGASNDAGPVKWTDAEDERWCLWIAENTEPEQDDPADHQSWED